MSELVLHDLALNTWDRKGVYLGGGLIVAFLVLMLVVLILIIV